MERLSFSPGNVLDWRRESEVRCFCPSYLSLLLDVRGEGRCGSEVTTEIKAVNTWIVITWQEGDQGSQKHGRGRPLPAAWKPGHSLVD